MFMANSHLKIMQSFVSAPQVHISALKNRAMRGGPFVNYDAEKVPQIKALMNRTASEQAHMFEFAEAIRNLDETLTMEAKGYSLEPLYKKVPDILKGYVELAYDLNNQPSVRFIEGLLYKSRFYNPSAQTIALSKINNDYRDFAFSSPKLTGDGILHLNVPFNDEALDELFGMKCAPLALGYIKEALDIRPEDDRLFSSFFTEERPQSRCKAPGNDVRIRYFGHACLLIETESTSILCDPLVSYEYENGLRRYTYDDLPESIDYVLITHTHQDHCLFETLLQLRHKIKNIVIPRSSAGELVDPSLKLVLQNIGFQNVTEIDEMESIEIDEGSITALPFMGEHADLRIRTKTAYLIRVMRHSILVGADSNNLEPALYEHIHDLVRDVDVVFLGMECDGAPLSWLYGPLLTRPLIRKMDQSRRVDGSNSEKALDIVKRLNPKQVYVYAMGQEPWLSFLMAIQYTEKSRPIVESNELVDQCRRRGVTSERLFGHKEILL